MDSVLAQVYITIGNLFSSVGKFIPAQYQQLALISVTIFLVILLLAWARHHMLEWTFKGANFGVFIGIVLTLVVEGFLLVGGKTLIAQVIRDPKTPPIVRETISKNLQELAGSVSPISRALGASGEIQAIDVVGDYQSLSKSEQSRARSLICTPNK